jgi:zinc/manganese transport system substrate-binding protein
MAPTRRKLLAGGLAATLAAACTKGGYQGQSKGPGPTIVATFSILASVVATLCGDKATVTSLVPAGIDAHDFDPPPSSVLAIKDAALVVGLGLRFDDWLSPMIAASGRTDTPILTGNGLPGLLERSEGRFDPHVWAAPDMAIGWVKACAAALETSLPALKTEIAANLPVLLAALGETAISAEHFAEAMEGEKRTVVVAHDAFGYLERALNIEFVAIHGLSKAEERGGAGMTRLVDQLKASGASACFPENIADPAALQQLSEQTGVKMGGRLYSDALSAPDGPAPDLPSLLASNLDTIARALAF